MRAIRLAAYPFSDRRHIDDTLDQLMQLLVKPPSLSKVDYYSIVALGAQSPLEDYKLQRSLLDILSNRKGGYRLFANYSSDFHGALTPDGRQIYMFQLNRFTGDEDRGLAFLELVLLKEALVSRGTIPGLTEIQYGLKLMVYELTKSRQRGNFRSAERYLEENGLQIVRGINR